MGCDPKEFTVLPVYATSCNHEGMASQARVIPRRGPCLLHHVHLASLASVIWSPSEMPTWHARGCSLQKGAMSHAFQDYYNRPIRRGRCRWNTRSYRCRYVGRIAGNVDQHNFRQCTPERSPTHHCPGTAHALTRSGLAVSRVQIRLHDFEAICGCTTDTGGRKFAPDSEWLGRSITFKAEPSPPLFNLLLPSTPRCVYHAVRYRYHHRRTTVPHWPVIPASSLPTVSPASTPITTTTTNSRVSRRTIGPAAASRIFSTSRAVAIVRAASAHQTYRWYLRGSEEGGRI
ncbi:hypothetical protein C8Q77DRAFT_140560 [Trametes polyzona]|nr:hypothetical protein C8Q77DRAFT_140560 [Trametes polyzona]